jgi:hypothetical protein
MGTATCSSSAIAARTRPRPLAQRARRRGARRLRLDASAWTPIFASDINGAGDTADLERARCAMGITNLLSVAEQLLPDPEIISHRIASGSRTRRRSRLLRGRPADPPHKKPTVAVRLRASVGLSFKRGGFNLLRGQFPVRRVEFPVGPGAFPVRGATGICWQGLDLPHRLRGQTAVARRKWIAFPLPREKPGTGRYTHQIAHTAIVRASATATSVVSVPRPPTIDRPTGKPSTRAPGMLTCGTPVSPP